MSAKACARCAQLEAANAELAKLNVELTKGQAELLRAGTDAVRKMISTGTELAHERATRVPRPQHVERVPRQPFRPRTDPEKEFAQ